MAHEPPRRVDPEPGPDEEPHDDARQEHDKAGEYPGHAVLGSRNYDAAGRLNQKPTAIELLYLRPGANSLATRAAVAKRMDELSKGFPAGVTYSIPFDTTPFVTASIDEVVAFTTEEL